MSILSLKNRIPSIPTDPNVIFNKGSLNALASSFIANQFKIIPPDHVAKVTDLKGIDWAKSFLWSFKFEQSSIFGKVRGANGGLKNYDLPKGYHSWFPCIDLVDSLQVVENKSIQTAFSTYDIPMGSTPKSLKISFIDDQQHTILRWFEDWMNYVLRKDVSLSGSRDLDETQIKSDTNAEGGILPLKNAARQVKYYQLNSKYTEVIERTYLVSPTGDITFNGNSSSDMLQYSIDLNIVGKSTTLVNLTSNPERGSGIGSKATKGLGQKIIDFKGGFTKNTRGINPFG